MKEPLYSFTLTYDPALLRAAAWAYGRKQVDSTFILAWLLLLGFVAYSFFYQDLAIFFNLSFVVFSLATMIMIGVYFRYYASAMRAYHAMEKKEVLVQLTPTHFNATANDAFSSFPYRQFSKIWQTPRFWLLFLNECPMTLTLKNFPPEAQAFFLAKLQENNVKIF